jgi:hypothetical protein
MARSFICPLCGDTRLQRLLTIDGATVVMTIGAFRCTENGHIFFLRKADTEEGRTLARPA